MKKDKEKNFNTLSVICRIAGTVVLSVAILFALPVTLPKLFGFRIYNVVTPSMVPALNPGSLVYVKETEASEIGEGDIIAFESDGEVVVHRAVENDTAFREVTTKGDANETIDIYPVPYNKVIGKVVFNIPKAGTFFMYLSTAKGRITAACFVLSGAILSFIGLPGKEDGEEEDDEK
ncbi:MAG: signal peptidase I [Firmicutes bacterium]|nr:signal peptidase I [Bacillota bacterium]